MQLTAPRADGGSGTRLIDPDTLRGRERYQLLTSLVVPRPIGWISTWGGQDVPNLAPFSYFAALSAAPMLVGVSIGRRGAGVKDTLANVRSRHAFCANIVSEPLLEAMNATSAEVAPEVDEFALSGLTAGRSDRVDAPYVVEAPATLECEVHREVDLGAANTLVIGAVVGIRVHSDLPFEDGSFLIDPERLRPVGRLGGGSYALPDRVRRLERPDVT